MSNVVSVQELFLTFPHAGSKAGHLGDDALTQSYPNPPPPPTLNLPKPPKRAMRNVVGVQELFLALPHAGSKAGHLGDDALTQS